MLTQRMALAELATAARLLFLLSDPFFPACPAGRGRSRADPGGSSPGGAQDVAFPGEQLQPAGVHPGRSPGPLEHQALHHLSGNTLAR